MVAEGDLLFEAVLSEPERAMVRDSIAQAVTRVTAAYGEMLGPQQQILWCKTRACATYYGGPSARSFASPGRGEVRDGAVYAFERPTIALLRQARAKPGSDLLAVETLTHEMSHAQMRARLGRASIPAWFNEGVATYLGKEHPCVPGMQGVDDVTKIIENRDWSTYTNKSNTALVNTYCQARNEVAAWIDNHGGFPAVLALLQQRANGTEFWRLYHR